MRRLLSDRGLSWREDASNRDLAFTRNRLRHGFLPFLERICGDEGVENLRAFGRAVEELEDTLAGATAHLAWNRAPYASASRGPGALGLGGVLQRADLMRVASPLRRRALWRLLTEGTGRSPARGLLESILADLAAGRCTRHTLSGNWVLLMRSAELHLLPPDELRSTAVTLHAEGERLLPFPESAARAGQRPWSTRQYPCARMTARPLC